MPLGRQPTLGWPVRNSIALGVANGLAYLHEECIRGIIHCDVIAGNILLDEDFQAVLSDFTMAKYMDSPDDGLVKGTIGQIAPSSSPPVSVQRKPMFLAMGSFFLSSSQDRIFVLFISSPILTRWCYSRW